MYKTKVPPFSQLSPYRKIHDASAWAKAKRMRNFLSIAQGIHELAKFLEMYILCLYAPIPTSHSGSPHIMGISPFLTATTMAPRNSTRARSPSWAWESRSIPEVLASSPPPYNLLSSPPCRSNQYWVLAEQGMKLMRADKGCAATALASELAIARLRLPLDLVVATHMTENIPGDVQGSSSILCFLLCVRV
jgi:hypothetical protein